MLINKTLVFIVFMFFVVKLEAKLGRIWFVAEKQYYGNNMELLPNYYCFIFLEFIRMEIRVNGVTLRSKVGEHQLSMRLWRGE